MYGCHDFMWRNSGIGETSSHNPTSFGPMDLLQTVQVRQGDGQYMRVACFKCGYHCMIGLTTHELSIRAEATDRLYQSKDPVLQWLNQSRTLSGLHCLVHSGLHLYTYG